MKTCIHIVSTFPPYKGGMGNSAREIAIQTAKLGHQVKILTARYNSSLQKKETSGNLSIIRLKGTLNIGNAAFLPHILWNLKGANILHLHYPFYGAQCFVWLYKIFHPRVKLVLHYHMEPKSDGIKGAIFSLNRKILLPLLIKAADAIIVSSQNYAKQYWLKNGFEEKYADKVFVVPFGVDIERFKPASEVLSDNQVTILFVGGLDKAHYSKGLAVLLKACALLDKSFQNWRLKIIGDGDMRAEYEKIAEQLGMQNKVEFLGRVSDADLPSAYQKCACFVLPSINQGEAFGMVLLEAMASGKPIIASKLPGVDSVFCDKKEGFYVKSRDVAMLCEKIKILLEKPDLAEKMGQSGRNLVEQKYAWEQCGREVVKIYENLFN